MYFNLFLSSTIGIFISVLLGFGIFQWLHIPAGNFLDWIIAGASFWWLLVIVTVPWNIHFQAKGVLAQGEQSRKKQIPVDETQIKYVQVLAKRSLVLAIGLHLISALALYILAITGISTVGYLGSGAALLLTGLRPAISAYQYLSGRLRMIREEFNYPREDIVELRHRMETVEATVTDLAQQLNPDNSHSLPNKQQRNEEETRKALARINANIEELRATNQKEHEGLSTEARQAIAQLSTDGQFLDHVREIIRFFKTA